MLIVMFGKCSQIGCHVPCLAPRYRLRCNENDLELPCLVLRGDDVGPAAQQHLVHAALDSVFTHYVSHKSAA